MGEERNGKNLTQRAPRAQSGTEKNRKREKDNAPFEAQDKETQRALRFAEKSRC
jgi:hypothetical protein